MASERQVLVPDIGDFEDVDVIEVLVAPGDRVDAEQSLVTLESEKATMEIPSPAAAEPVRSAPRSGPPASTRRAHASPSVRRLAREFGVDLPLVRGSGPKSRI